MFLRDVSRRDFVSHLSALASLPAALVAAGSLRAQAPAAQANQTPAPATLSITGDVSTPLTLKAEDLAAMPREKASVTEQDGSKV